MKSEVKRNTFSILFFINRAKTNKKDEHPIYCRVTVQGISRQFSTQHWVLDNKWDPRASRVVGSNESAKTVNHSLNSIRNNLLNIRADLTQSGDLVSAETVVNKHLGKGERIHTLVQIHEMYNDRIKNLIGKDYANGTYGRYKISIEHLKKFLKYQYNKDDLLLNSITHSLASDYEYYLKTKNECSNNTAVKYVKNLKAVINFAVTQGYMKFNPLDKWKGKLERVDKGYLNEDELSAIAARVFSNRRIEEVRDIFVFCCYTGLAYSDVLKLTSNHIVIGMNGKKQISITRTKTDTLVTVPLLEEALNIINRYADHPICLETGQILPVKSNQKLNEYLKEIAELCGINKTLTTHIARHTFATRMLTLGASMESVSAMLGHTDIKTTQIYGKIIADKVVKEMDKIDDILRTEKTHHLSIAK